MYRGLKVSHRPALTACVPALTLALAFVWTGFALAGGPYAVRVKVKPSKVLLGASFTVTAAGVSRNQSQLKVFLNATKQCARDAAADASSPGDSLKINAPVKDAYSKAKTFTAVDEGTHYVCAYLTAPASSTHTRARAGASYTATPGFY